MTFLVAVIWLVYSVTLTILVAGGGYFFAQCIHEIWRNEYATDEEGIEDQESNGEDVRFPLRRPSRFSTLPRTPERSPA